MKLIESQAKAIFAEAGIPVPVGRVATTPEEARAIAQEIGGRVVVKAQVPIGGRGKAGGIQLADDPEGAFRQAQRILGMDVRGYKVARVLVEQAADIAQEFYLSITVDRDRQANVVILSAAGGMDIEEIAEKHPEKVAKLWLTAGLGLRDFHIRQLAVQAGVPAELLKQLAPIMRKVYEILKSYDATLVEINPLARLADGRLVALDGKMEIDDNALFRQQKLAALKEAEGDHPLELEARRRGLAYVKLDGNVGVIGNGAGLVMTTLDMIQRNGGKAANFLDIGGGAKAEVVRNALEVVLSDPDVKSVLINVFGGITRCDEVARGLLDVMRSMEVKVPVVVRLAGTREEEGRRLLEGTELTPAATFQEAARKAVLAAQG
ncbi:MAG: ADP-forming succinate--CoA ligase subunit beta [Bacillota bacterium]|nr:MAG: ADP-forming succinate--CoA ligase subunit beta [Bacillota bacterium]